MSDTTQRPPRRPTRNQKDKRICVVSSEIDGEEDSFDKALRGILSGRALNGAGVAFACMYLLCKQGLTREQIRQCIIPTMPAISRIVPDQVVVVAAIEAFLKLAEEYR